MIADFIDFVANGVLGLGVANITLLTAVVALAVYWHRAQSVFALLGTWIGKLVFATVSIGVLNAVGVIEEISFTRAVELVSAVIAFLLDLLPPGLI